MAKLPSQRPLSITLIAIHYLLLNLPLVISLATKITVFWWTFSGIPALCIFMFHTVSLLYLSFGLWKLREMARRLAICYECFVALSVWVDIGLTSNWAEVRDAYAQHHIDTPPSFFIWVGILLSVPSVIIIWFLIRRKSAFAHASDTGASQQ